MFKEILERLLEHKDLTEAESFSIMSKIMSGELSSTQIGAFLVALRMKGETVAEITGAAKAMREKAAKIYIKDEVVDTCGTGGDKKGSFNVSTTTAFVVAGAGLKVAKHGNRSISSRCGSADVLEALGVKIDLPPQRVKECIEKVGIGFLFAPNFHPAMKHALSPRRELGIRTIFNLLGPLTNPAGPAYQLIGVYSPNWLYPMAEVLKELGLKGAMVVHGEGGYDEITVTGKTTVAELKNGNIEMYEITPEMFGLERAQEENIVGGDRETNAQIILKILSDKGDTDSTLRAKKDMVLLNSAAVFKICNLVETWQQGIALAQNVIKKGKAKAKLEALKRETAS